MDRSLVGKRSLLGIPPILLLLFGIGTLVHTTRAETTELCYWNDYWNAPITSGNPNPNYIHVGIFILTVTVPVLFSIIGIKIERRRRIEALKKRILEEIEEIAEELTKQVI